MSNEHIRLSSIEGIKQLARRFKKSDQIPHALALERASKAAGFGSFKHARRELGSSTTATKPSIALYISAFWRDANTKAIGCEVLQVQLSTPLDTLLKPAQYRASRDLATMRRVANDHLEDTYRYRSQEGAREAACKAARTIQFMEVTGLVPSKAKRSFPRGDYQNRMPGSDHDMAWYDPTAKAYIRTNEPYARKAVTAEQHLWAERHGWTVVASPWKGMYRPDGGSWLFLLADASKGYSLQTLLSRLAAAPPPIVASPWSGETRPTFPAFVSPGQEAEMNAPATKKDDGPRAPQNSVKYQVTLGGSARRPKARMPIESHKSIGRHLKSVLFATRRRAGVQRRIDAIRCELDNWAACEYERPELSHSEFVNLYYGELWQSDPPAAVSASRDRHVDNLVEVKAMLVRHYPDCRPLRMLLKKADLAIASLRTWSVPPRYRKGQRPN